MSLLFRGILITALVVIIGVVPFVAFRAVYDHNKRLREVVPGRLYRSGQMTAAGFAEAVQRFHLRTIVNVQDDFPDPDIDESFWSTRTVKESDLCQGLGVQFRTVAPDLVRRRNVPAEHPAAIDDFLAILDEPANYPVLVHCRAGLHRTGVLIAVYRMEYQGWSVGDAWRELRAHGFGEWVCTASNDYITQYVLTYQPRGHKQQARVRGLRLPGELLPPND
jgi:protein tyrosine phosphatase (PTP) superfamily phosphohydrolase (DUF442 family)